MHRTKDSKSLIEYASGSNFAGRVPFDKKKRKKRKKRKRKEAARQVLFSMVQGS